MNNYDFDYNGSITEEKSSGYILKMVYLNLKWTNYFFAGFVLFYFIFFIGFSFFSAIISLFFIYISILIHTNTLQTEEGRTYDKTPQNIQNFNNVDNLVHRNKEMLNKFEHLNLLLTLAIILCLLEIGVSYFTMSVYLKQLKNSSDTNENKYLYLIMYTLSIRVSTLFYLKWTNTKITRQLEEIV